MTISLDDVTPAVSRTIEVPFGIRLDRLHTIFQEALGWTDSHLWELTFGRTGFGIPDPSYGFGGPLDARKATLAEALEGMRGKTFQYLYDFGDGWEHSVKIQGIAPADPQGTYPRLLEATGIRMENAAFGGIAQAHGHLQRPDCPGFLHPVADRPTNHSAAEQIDDEIQVKPALGGPDISDVASPFLVRQGGQKIAVQQVGGNAEVMLAVSGDLVPAGANGPYPIDVGYAALRVINRPIRRSPTSMISMVMRGRT